MIMSTENVVQTLKEVGCNKQTIESYIEHEGNQKRQLTILYNQRKKQLETVHKHQKRLDDIDFLIYSISKEQQI
ncbi:MAG: hypothetical protein J1F01_08640 [Oscillospiraceae bacterium]|nr:hypothetical protein [Oscillospiraceae bacterium]